MRLNRDSLKFIALSSWLLTLSTLLFALSSSYAATEVVKTICPSGQGCNYTSLSAWEAGEQRDLVALDEIAVAKIQGDWTGVTDTTPVIIDGFITDSTRYIKIYTTPEARHNGKWDDTKYKLITNGTQIRVQDPHVRIDGLQLKMTSLANHGSSGIILYSGGAVNEMYVENLIIQGLTDSTYSHYGIYVFSLGNAGSKAYIWNNIIYNVLGSTGRGISISEADHTAYVYNNTVYNNYLGIQRELGTAISKNNISYNNTDNYSGTFDAASTNNLSGPTQTDAPGSNPRNGVTVTFVDAANKDFHLASNDAGARNYGADLSGDANLAFTTDIDGETRPGEGTWDIGADEYIQIIKEVLDSIGLTDSILICKTLYITDSISASDISLRDWSPQVIETISLEDVILRDKTLQIADTTTLSDSILTDKTLNIIDSISLSDLIQLYQKLTLIEDSINLSDSVILDKLNIIEDTISLADVMLINKTLQILETIGLTDAVYRDQALEILDSISLTDSILRDKIFTILDAINAMDEVKRDRALAILDSISLSDIVIIETAQIIKEILDSIGLSDTVLTDKIRIITDTISVMESVLISKILIATDQITLSDLAIITKIIEILRGSTVKQRSFDSTVKQRSFDSTVKGKPK
jgi:hypothetical protein